MIFARKLRRPQVGDVLSGRARDLQGFETLDEVPRPEVHSIVAIWLTASPRRAGLPDYLVTAAGTLRDWLAWLVTFAPNLRPLTAHCRVIEWSEFERAFVNVRTPTLNDLENAYVGLVLGEVLSSEDALGWFREHATVTACASTVSFALARAVSTYLHTSHDLVSDIGVRWHAVRHTTRQRERSLHWHNVGAVVECLVAIDAPHPVGGAIAHACRELATLGEIASETTLLGPHYSQFEHMLRGTREERLEAFEFALDTIPSGSLEGGFAVGYLASRINPGTLSHAAMVARALPQHPTAMLWYGVCAGLSSGGPAILNELGGIGRRIVRELLAPEEVKGKPRADVSAAELDILLAGERADDFIVYSSAQLTVELFPGIATVVPWSSRTRAKRYQPTTAERSLDPVWLDHELTAGISRLVELQRRIRSGATEPTERSGGFQTQLFEPPTAQTAKRRKR